MIYWAGAAATAVVRFGLSSRAEYVHESYYASLIFSVAAIVVLLARSGAAVRWLVSANASIFFAAGTVGLTRHYMESFVLPIARTPGYAARDYVPTLARYARQIASFVRANGAEVGYAGYGNASDLTWHSGERILVRPVQLCRTTQGVGVCQFFLATVPSWYTPTQHRTFLLVDSTESYLPSLPEGLGRPLAVRTFGPTQVYVYPYDVATRIGPAMG